MTSAGQMAEGGFVEPEDGFADDDLLSPDDLSGWFIRIDLV